MKHLFLALACLIPSVCLGEDLAFVDMLDNVKIKTDLNTVEYGGSRTIYFDNNDGSTVTANLPADVGYIYIYNAATRKGVIEFSRPSYRYNQSYPLYNGRSCYGSSHYGW